MKWNFDNTYTSLPTPLWSVAKPLAPKDAAWFVTNKTLAGELGLTPDEHGSFDTTDLGILSGRHSPPGSDFFAQAYAGHQFGHFTMLGDGRCAMVGEHLTPGGSRFDIQLKGSGPTGYSRRGDGLAALGPMLREYIMGEAMTALGIPSTRALAVITTGETISRDRRLPGAILVRVADSHLRVGTFEYGASTADLTLLRSLADYALARHYPDCLTADAPYRSFFRAITERQALLVAQWLSLGFVHGVMNTDNMAISGQTIDYGPCAFIDRYDPLAVFSSIDSRGRYALTRQQAIAQWNLARLAEALFPLFGNPEADALNFAQDVLAGFEIRFKGHYYRLMADKLGLVEDLDSAQNTSNLAIIDQVLGFFASEGLDYTASFTALTDLIAQRQIPESVQVSRRVLDNTLKNAPWFQPWLDQTQRNPQAASIMIGHNPVYIPRNHLVEEVLNAATNSGETKALTSLLGVLTHPWQRQEGAERYEEEPPQTAMPYQTFCGT